MDTLGSPALAYGQQLTAAVREALGESLVAAYLHGSAAMGGWTSDRSDVDLLFVTSQVVTAGEMDRITAAANRIACPGTGLELSIVRDPITLTDGPPPFELHLCTGPGAKVLHGTGHPGDPDLVMHFAVCLARGVTVFGPPPGALLPPIPRPRMLAALLEELEWASSEAPRHYAVLNACRAAAFAEMGGVLSKLEGAEWATRAGFHPQLAQAAWTLQQNNRGSALDASAVDAALRDASDRLRAKLELEA